MKIVWMVLMVTFRLAAAAEQYSLETLQKQLSKSPSYTYPYVNLAKELASQGQSVLKLFAYGSLIDKNSAKKTFSEKTLNTSRPSLAFGVQRLFNRDVPIQQSAWWGKPLDPQARGMLNLKATEYQRQFVNGVLIEIPLEEIGALLAREVGYDLKPVLIADWNTLLKGELLLSIAYTLIAGPTSSYVNASILPRPGYYELTRNAAAEFGPLFSLFWLHTTYMADGKTPIIEWENQRQKKDPKIDYIGWSP